MNTRRRGGRGGERKGDIETGAIRDPVRGGGTPG